MIRYFELTRWKSFAFARLDIQPVTLLIGANASGKSNSLDGIEFMHRTALGREIGVVLTGDATETALRGGAEWASYFRRNDFALSCLISGDSDLTDYKYEIEVSVRPRMQLKAERLVRRKYRPNSDYHTEVSLFSTDDVDHESPSISARLYNGKAGTRRDFRRTTSVLSQLEGFSQREDIEAGVSACLTALQNVFKLDPVPSRMRDYSKLSDDLSTDAGNLAGVIAALPDDEREKTEQRLSELCSKLPERDVLKVYVERVGKFQSDAMLYCEEEWLGRKKSTLEIDARGISDGTLRFLAIVTALLTRPNGSLIVIEEIDNGLFPARSQLLLKVVRDIAQERKVDVLFTTHNATLLDGVPPDVLPTITVAHRDVKNGSSTLTRLEDVNDLPKLLAIGGVGSITAQGLLDRALTGGEKT